MFKKFFTAAKKYLLKDTRYFFLYLYRYPQKNYAHTCLFMNENTFIEKIQDGKSIIRIGDGEIGLLHYLPIHYQVWNKDIRNDFLRIITTYSDKSPYILLIPLFVNESNEKLEQINKLSCWMPLKVSYEMFFNKSAHYFDQHIFYRDGKYEQLLLKYLKQKKVIVVTNNKNKDFLSAPGVLDLDVTFVISPSENAYEERGYISQQIETEVAKKAGKKEDFVIIMAAGLSKTIIYELSFKGYQLLDIGKGFESYYKKESIEYQI